MQELTILASFKIVDVLCASRYSIYRNRWELSSWPSEHTALATNIYVIAPPPRENGMSFAFLAVTMQK